MAPPARPVRADGERRRSRGAQTGRTTDPFALLGARSRVALVARPHSDVRRHRAGCAFYPSLGIRCHLSVRRAPCTLCTDMKALLLWMEANLDDPQSADYLLKQAPRWAHLQMASHKCGAKDEFQRLAALAEKAHSCGVGTL